MSILGSILGSLSTVWESLNIHTHMYLCIYNQDLKLLMKIDLLLFTSFVPLRSTEACPVLETQ